MAEISFRDELRRKAVHLSSLWMPVVMLCFAPYRWGLAVFFGVLALASVLVEHAYARGNLRIRRAYDFFFGGMLRKEPEPSDWVVSGGPPVLAAACMVLLCFPPELAASAMALMLLGDTAAALVGRRWGRTRFANGKSLEGVVAFVLIGAIGFAVFLSFRGIPLIRLVLVSLAAAAVGALAEFFEKKIHVDDNFGIPFFSGWAAVLLLRLLG